MSVPCGNCGCNCYNCGPCDSFRRITPCGRPVHTPWCYPSCPPRMTPASSPNCGPTCYTSPRPCCRCCKSFSVCRENSAGKLKPKTAFAVPPPKCGQSSYPYGACSFIPSSIRHNSYCAGGGCARCSSGY